MSQTLGTILGKEEFVVDVNTKQVGYKDAALYVTSLGDRPERGHSLQMSIISRTGIGDHIQLDNDAVKELKEILNKHY